MIHTFELQKQITPEEVKRIISRCSFHTSYSAKNDTIFYTTKEFRDMGINEVTIMKLPSQAEMGYDFFIRLVVNPSVITPPVNAQVEKEDARNYPTGINAFSELYIFSLYDYLYSIFPELNAHRSKASLTGICKVEDIRRKEALYNEWHEDNYHSFMLNRIDYTFDISLCPQEYLTLLNRGYKLTRAELKEFEHEYGAQNVDAKNKSIEFKIYDKERQLKETMGASSVIAQKHPVLRIELSMLKPKMYDVRNRRQKQVERTLFDFADADIGFEYVEKYLTMIAGSGDYVDYDTAIGIIDNSEYSNNIKLKLKALVLAISKHRGIETYLKTLTRQKKPTVETVKKHLKMIHALGINPVTISKKGFENVPSDNGVRFLPSLLKIVRAYYHAESPDFTEDGEYKDMDKWVKVIEEHEEY